MVLAAFVLLATGIAVALLGYKFLRILLPLFGLVSGTAVGFIGFQGVFGTGAVSTTIAVFVAITVGLMLAVLSYLFFELAVTIYIALLGAAALSYLGVALGLGDNGFVMLLLTIAGFVIGLTIASAATFTTSLVIALTSFAGVALVLASIFLVAGNVSLDQLHQNGIIRSVMEVIDQSFLWLFVWLGGSFVAMNVQRSTMRIDMLDNAYQFKESK